MSRITESLVCSPVNSINGRIKVPGDKSISHRALMFAALAEGTTEINGFLAGEDCLATMAALQSMGVTIRQHNDDSVTVEGVGLHGLKPSSGKLDMGNSGTGMRLMAGLLAAQSFDSEMIGDASLNVRPMERVAIPLRLMGARVATTDGCPPLVITGGASLQGIDYQSPTASAQVKSAVLLAGLYAQGETSVTEPGISRDHTERMLGQFGWQLSRQNGRVTLSSGGQLSARAVNVPGDFSSAAFFIVAALIAGKGELVIEGVGLNPTRTGFLRILQLMGADIDVSVRTVEDDQRNAEPTGQLRIRPGPLYGMNLPAELVSLAIDEFPLVFILAALADGETIVSGAEELRHKESDRIGAMVKGLQTLGINADERPDGARISGGQLTGGIVDSCGDHRVAMAFAVASIAAKEPIHIQDTANVATSFPGFCQQARNIGMAVEQIEKTG